MRIVNFLLALIFLLFSFLQVNDPDAFIWIVVYGAMAVLCILAMYNVYPVKVLYALLLVYLAYSLIYLPGVKQWLASDDRFVIFRDLTNMRDAYVEETREFFGLMICVIVLLLHLIRSKRLARP